MKRVVFMLLVAAFFSACEKEKPLVYSSSLIGEWEWFISCGGVRGCWYPTSQNTMKYVFTADSIFEMYINDTLRSSNRFFTRTQVSEDLIHSTKIINLGTSSWVYIIRQDTLNLFDLDIFNAGSAFKRIK